MKRLFVILILFLFALSVYAVEYTFQVTPDRVDGKCVGWQDITDDVSYKEIDGVKVVYTDLPDPVAVDDDDLQEKFVDAEGGVGDWLVSFSFTGVGLEIPDGMARLEYWFRYSKNGIFSNSCVVAVVRPGDPINK